MLRLLLHVVRHLHILASVKFIKGLKPSGSFAMESYHGIHAYYLADASGNRKAFRYHWFRKTSRTFPARRKSRAVPTNIF